MEITMPVPHATTDKPAIEAVIFDMDGVVTQSMYAHFAAWKEIFDAFLEGRGDRHATFTIADYFAHVDGVPRLDGVRRFLASRGIALSEGGAESLDLNTVHGLANRKNQRFRAWLSENPVPAYADALDLIHALKERRIKVGVFSASRNAQQVLKSAGVIDLFDAKVDGIDAEQLALPPKPAPGMLTETAARLGVAPANTIVIEDAVSGVEAGTVGGFAYVIGIDREARDDEAHARDLRASGADIVTRDLGKVLNLCCPTAGEARQ